MLSSLVFFFFFFFNDTATTEIYTLSLHDALPISDTKLAVAIVSIPHFVGTLVRFVRLRRDRKSTRLNSSHSQISYAVFCLKKKKKNNHILAIDPSLEGLPLDSLPPRARSLQLPLR